ncbi:MAG: fibronectin type III domain-containing protein [Thermoplasmata archaeon]
MKTKFFTYLVVLILCLSTFVVVMNVGVEGTSDTDTIDHFEIVTDIPIDQNLYVGPSKPDDFQRDHGRLYNISSGNYTIREPIRINNDTDFATQGWNGIGTPGDPYIIEGFEIDGEGQCNCISIGNTTVHFELRDNYVHNASGNNGKFFRNTGLNLYNIINGTVIDNIVANDHDGIDGNTYYYLVSAVSSAGEGDQSEEVSTRPSTTPSAPQNLQATPGDEQVLLEWDAPLDDGGSAIKNYTVYRGTEPGNLTLLVAIGNMLNYTDENVDNDVTYYYQVSAVNTVGEGELSEEASAIPSADEFIPTDLVLEVTPTTGTAPLEVTIYVSGENIGEIYGEIDVVIDDTVVYTLELPAQESAEYTFTHTFDHAGEYLVEFGDETETVYVDEAPYVDIVVISPSGDQRVSAGTSFPFTARAYDQYGSLITEDASEFTWTGTDVNGVFYQETVGGYDIAAAYEGVTSETITMTVVPAGVHVVMIVPEGTTTLTAGTQLQFSAEAYDGYDNFISDHVTDFSWINAIDGLFYQEVVGDYDVTATYNGVTSEAVTVTVTTGDVHTVNVSPHVPRETPAGENLTFTAHAYDGYGNLITDQVTDFSWENADLGVFNEEVTGEYNITAQYHGTISTPITVTVVPGDVHSVTISPLGYQEIQAGENLTFTAHAYDGYGNLITDQVTDFSWENAVNGLFDKGPVGDYNITAEYGGIDSENITVTVVPGEAYTVVLMDPNGQVITPDETRFVRVGESYSFSAESYDRYDNLITATATDFIWQGTDENGVFYQDTAGDYGVVTSYDDVDSNFVIITVVAEDEGSDFLSDYWWLIPAAVILVMLVLIFFFKGKKNGEEPFLAGSNEEYFKEPTVQEIEDEDDSSLLDD